MYDALTASYTFSCPTRGEIRVRLSAFRRLARLPGATHPAVFRVSFACPCGGEHAGLVSHDELDWAPLGLGGGSFLDLMTDRPRPVGEELAALAARRIGDGSWPWSFFCFPEDRPRPVFPSAFRLLAPGAPGGSLGLAVRCPDCGKLSLNLVTRAHVDLPFHNDPEVGVVAHVFPADRDALLEEFRSRLYSADFDARRLQLG